MLNNVCWTELNVAVMVDRVCWTELTDSSSYVSWCVFDRTD